MEALHTRTVCNRKPESYACITNYTPYAP